MCGFFFIKKNGVPFDLKSLENCSNLLSHRGPDNNKFYKNSEIYLRFFRLSIQDTSLKASQPMFDISKRYLIVFNGEIYNFLDLKKRLRTNKLVSNSDTEVLLYSLIERGSKVLRELEGMFSFIFYDLKENTALVARDRLGIKPLYYMHYKESFIFSSEIKPMLSFLKNIQIDNESFCNFFLKGSMDIGNQTFFKNIFSVEPGEYGIIKQRKFLKTKYWDLSKTVKNSKINTSYKKNKSFLKELLKDSLKKHLISDRKVGLFLSGGTDSNALLNLMLENKKDTKKIQSFSYGFKNFEKYGELPRIKKIISNKEVSNLNFYLKPKDVLENFSKTTEILEGPFTSIRLIAMKKLYNLANKNNCRVTIEGDGGDEIFGGYDYNLFSSLKDRFKSQNDLYKVLSKLKKFLLISGKNKNQIINLLLTNTFQFSSTSDGTIFVNSDYFKEQFLNKHIDESFFNYKKKKNLNNLQNSQYKDLFFTKLPRTLRYKDRLSMSEGIEARVPLLDHRIVEFAFNLPNEYKFKDLKSRYIFKDLFSSIAKKNQFEFSKRTIADPQKIWLKTHLKDFFLDNINSINFKKLDYFNYKVINKEFLEFCKNDKYPTTFAFFQILSFYKFYDIFCHNQKFHKL